MEPIINTDWNSFFGTFAQSAAAIIGIIAAFLISKILGENEKLELQSDSIDRLVIKYYHIKSKIAIRHFEWYDKRQIEYSSELEKMRARIFSNRARTSSNLALNASGNQRIARALLTKAIEKDAFAGLSKEQRLEKLYEIMPKLYRTPDCEFELNKRIKDMEPIYLPMGGGKSFKQAKYTMLLAPNGLWDNLSEERELISQLEIESHTLINKFKRAQKALSAMRKNIKPLQNAIYLQSAAFLITVVYPLHFMPMAAGVIPKLGFTPAVIAETLFSFKGFFLLLLCLLILGIFGYFLFVIRKLLQTYDAIESSLLPDYVDLTKYSEYFRNNPT